MNPQERETIFRRWTAEHAGMIARGVRGFANDAADRDDLHQEMLLALWKAIPAFRSESKVSTFVYRVLHNTALTWLRRSQRSRLEPMFAPELIPDTPTDDGRVFDVLQRHIDSLGPIDR